MPPKAIHSPNTCVVRPDLSALWRSRYARRLVRWMSTVASATTQMLRGRIVVGLSCRGDGVRQGAQFAVGGRPKDGGNGVVFHVEALCARVMRTGAQPTVGLRCLVLDASVK